MEISAADYLQLLAFLFFADNDYFFCIEGRWHIRIECTPDDLTSFEQGFGQRSLEYFLAVEYASRLANQERLGTFDFYN